MRRNHRNQPVRRVSLGMTTLSTRHAPSGQREAGPTGAPEDEISGQEIPELIGDGRGVDFATLDSQPENVLHQRTSLVNDGLASRH